MEIKGFAQQAKTLFGKLYAIEKDLKENNASIEQIYNKRQAESAITAKTILDDLIKDDPQCFNLSQLRTLQRKIKAWGTGHLANEREKIFSKTNASDIGNDYLALAITAS